MCKKIKSVVYYEFYYSRVLPCVMATAVWPDSCAIQEVKTSAK